MILNKKETDSFGAERNLHYICGANGLAAILTNDCKVLLTGEDMYGNKASSFGRIVSGIDLVTFGVTKKLIKSSEYVYKLCDKIGTGITWLTVASTTINQYNK